MAVDSEENFSGGGENEGCRIAMISWQKNKFTLPYDTCPRGFAPSIHVIYCFQVSIFGGHS